MYAHIFVDQSTMPPDRRVLGNTNTECSGMEGLLDVEFQR